MSKKRDDQWALYTKSALDRTRLALANKVEWYLRVLQPSAEYLGSLLGVDQWAIFFLQGRFIFGPDIRSLGLTIILIVAPVIIFCVFVAGELMDDFSYHLGISIMVVVVAFTLYEHEAILNEMHIWICNRGSTINFHSPR